MKKYLYVAVAVALSVLVLSGCQKNNTENTEIKIEPEVEFTQEIKEFNPEVDSPKTIITEANKVYSRFETDPFEYDEEHFIEIDGKKYYRVLYSNLNTESDMRSYLKNYFSDEITDSLINNGVYKKGDDGYLYTDGIGIEEDKGFDFENAEYSIDEAGENEYRYSVKVENDGNIITFNFYYAKINGKWVFIEFKNQQ